MLTLPTHQVAPATNHALKTLKGIIYAIVNNYDGKTYIGKSKNTFRKRYGLKWWEQTVNVLLLRTLNGHAKAENFNIYILEAGIKDAQLNKREKYYASLLNTYCPNGYNIRECGESAELYGEEFVTKKQRSIESIRKTYQVKNIANNEIITITHLSDWCKKNQIREMAFRNLLCGIVKTSQGFCLPETIIKPRLVKVKGTQKIKEYRVKKISTGEIFSFNNAVIFARDNGLTLQGFKTMLIGKSISSQDYCLPNTILPKKKLFQVTSPTGEVIQIESLQQFDKENGTHLSQMHRRWQTSNRAGWTNLQLLREAVAGHVPNSKYYSNQDNHAQHST